LKKIVTFEEVPSREISSLEISENLTRGEKVKTQDTKFSCAIPQIAIKSETDDAGENVKMEMQKSKITRYRSVDYPGRTD